MGKQRTPTIESAPLNVRTRIKRLVRRTMCFSKTTTIRDLVIGFFIKHYEFGLLIGHGINSSETPSYISTVNGAVYLTYAETWADFWEFCGA